MSRPLTRPLTFAKAACRVRAVGVMVLAAWVTGCATGPDMVTEPPKLQQTIRPEYPAAARHAMQEGRVVLRVSILADGTVGQAAIHSSSGFPLLDASALAAAQRARFSPARTASGKAVGAQANLPIRFVLE